MPKRIFILNGHPADTSISRQLAETYANAAVENGHDIRIQHLPDLQFDADFGFGGYSETKPLEPSLESFLDNLKWAEHIVLVTPMWWGGLPAKLKGLIDRTFLPGQTFDTRNKTKTGFPMPMLSGRTARLILTSDTPWWLMLFGYCNALLHQLRKQVFGFVGISPMRVSHFVGASHPKPKQIEWWTKRTRDLGHAAA